MGQIFVAIGIGIATVLAALWVWLRPIYLQTLKAQADVEAAEKRIQQETDFQRNAILLEAKESALKIREQTEAEAREKLAALAKTEDRLGVKDESLEHRRVQLEEKESKLAQEAKVLAEKELSITTRLKSMGDVSSSAFSCHNRTWPICAMNE